MLPLFTISVYILHSAKHCGTTSFRSGSGSGSPGIEEYSHSMALISAQASS